MGKPILFMLTPWIEGNDQGPFYCPDCALVEGFFVYSPKVKDQVEVISVDFQRPRKKVVDSLGMENQSCPVLVLEDGAALPKGAQKSFSTGRVFIDDPNLICRYLGERFKAILPHPRS
jgi:hypothetical protein